jgi:hypothetical protein
MTQRIVLIDRIEYRVEGILHREDGPKNLSQILPAVEWAYGHREWRVNGNGKEVSRGYITIYRPPLTWIACLSFHRIHIHKAS